VLFPSVRRIVCPARDLVHKNSAVAKMGDTQASRERFDIGPANPFASPSLPSPPLPFPALALSFPSLALSTIAWSVSLCCALVAGTHFHAAEGRRLSWPGWIICLKQYTRECGHLSQ